ncbi:MAG TPA: TrmH family RNA methyltransferase [Candidatus Dormibacteraeota bacterium]|nr:TrmH family RNA methyltransferase [Candidatus Dormibacteraeota bacterium]
MVQLTLILDNLRSSYNVGSLLRTCDSAGVNHIICCGTTPYPRLPKDARDPVVINRNTREIAKSALGAEKTVKIEYYNDTSQAVSYLHQNGWVIYVLELAPNATNILDFKPKLPAALIVGNEVSGVSERILNMCDEVLCIPQAGSKESLNVSVAAGIAIYQLIRN